MRRIVDAVFRAAIDHAFTLFDFVLAVAEPRFAVAIINKAHRRRRVGHLVRTDRRKGDHRRFRPRPPLPAIAIAVARFEVDPGGDRLAQVDQETGCRYERIVKQVGFANLQRPGTDGLTGTGIDQRYPAVAMVFLMVLSQKLRAGGDTGDRARAEFNKSSSLHTGLSPRS